MGAPIREARGGIVTWLSKTKDGGFVCRWTVDEDKREADVIVLMDPGWV